MDQHPYVANNLMSVCIRCGRLQDTRRVFDALVKKDVISWNIMIGGYAQHRSAEDAMGVFNQMVQAGVQPTEVTYLSILKACASPSALQWGKEVYELFLPMQREGCVPNAFTYVSILNASPSAEDLEWVKEVHNHAVEAGLEIDLHVGNALLHMYAKSGRIDDACESFDRMDERDVVTWTVMIGGLTQHGHGREAYELFLRMRREGCAPNAVSYMSLLNERASAGAVEWVKEVHNHAVEPGFDSDVRVGNALLHMYAKSGNIHGARSVLDRMEERDVITWTAMIGGLAQHGFGHEALEVFRKMNGDGVRPHATSFVAVLSACSHAGLVDDGRRLFLAMTQDYGIEPTVLHYNCMVDLLGRAGRLEKAELFIGNMPVEPNVATWGALLGACRIHGNVELAEHAATELLKLGPNLASTYLLLSNIYAAAGMWEEVSLVRRMMQERGIRKEAGRSWIEVDNKIHGFVAGDASPQKLRRYMSR